MSMARDLLASTADDSLAIRMFDILRRRRLLAFATFSAVLAAAVSFAIYLPDIYQGQALVLIERPVDENIVRAADSAPGELESRLHIIKQEILSRDRALELIKRFNLYPKLMRSGAVDDALNQLRSDVEVNPSGPEQVSGKVKTVSFTLTYTGDSAKTAADVTNAIAAFYVQQNDSMRSQSAIGTLQFLRQQLSEAKAQLDRQDAAITQFTSKYTGQLPQQVGINLATLERMNTQLRLNGEQQLRLIEQREKLMEGLQDPGNIARAENPDATPEMLERLKQIEKLKSDLTQLLTRVTPKHPDVVRLQEQIADLEQQQKQDESALDEKRAAIAAAAAARGQAEADAQAPRRQTIDSLDAQLAKLRDEEQVLRSTIASFEQRLQGAPEREQEFALVTRDRQVAKDLYDSMLKRYDEAQLAASLETDRQGERFRVLEGALPPEGPTGPNRIRLILMGVLLALAAGVGMVLTAEQFDASFHAVDEVREFTSVPVLVSIPPIGPMPMKRRLLTGLAAVSAIAMIALIATASAYFAYGNDQLARLIGRAG
jgi:polysaccharide chain length determinant protein (PEP-CTERM system associated)